MTGRCHLVYALAPSGIGARDANDRFNEYIEDRARGLVVSHDHFVGKPHGGYAVFDVRTDEELARLDDSGPLEGWQLTHHPLTFSLTAVGFAAQLDFTLEAYRDTSLEQLAAAEEPDKRFWWQRRRGVG